MRYLNWLKVQRWGQPLVPSKRTRRLSRDGLSSVLVGGGRPEFEHYTRHWGLQQLALAFYIHASSGISHPVSSPSSHALSSPRLLSLRPLPIRRRRSARRFRFCAQPRVQLLQYRPWP
eukprot:2474661-Pleurochrysis_carterae.AAC.2